MCANFPTSSGRDVIIMENDTLNRKFLRLLRVLIDHKKLCGGINSNLKIFAIIIGITGVIIRSSD
jgi:hypothetical protein